MVKIAVVYQRRHKQATSSCTPCAPLVALPIMETLSPNAWLGYATLARMVEDELPASAPVLAFADPQKAVRSRALAEGLSALLVDLESLVLQVP
jgi:hypothetical protein